MIKDKINVLLPLFFFALFCLNLVAFFWHRSTVSGYTDVIREQSKAFKSELEVIHSGFTSEVARISAVLSRSEVPASSRSVEVVDSPGSDAAPASPSVSKPFVYFVFQGMPAIQYYGRFFQVGSPMSFGRVVRIFPDAVYFDNGTVLYNTLNPDAQKEVMTDARN